MERVLLLDESGNAVGTQDKAAVHHADTPLHLAFSCYVFDAGGRLLVTRRALHKKTWPGVWTNSCCGHPLPDERLEEAVRRRLDDELGLTGVGRLNLALPAFRYRAVMDNGVVENEMCPVFFTFSDGGFAPNPEEVDSGEWVPWAEFSAGVLDGTREISPWAALQIPALVALGPDPRDWPVASPESLPPAAR
ncbi:isopentenyl-diphosphate Delta-isomerase [Umezawaea beigongshangensis]|uniref:isopentenyl-diphosphate Delta-isomerase n=1 Tax=Umezawaea beigongshangensis TaxID=2780383 RepID=UPI0027DB49C3|nr:isopentenyl-diphosphate Delta-isomerase [Umezawaea beigongshangensis]